MLTESSSAEVFYDKIRHELRVTSVHQCDSLKSLGRIIGAVTVAFLEEAPKYIHNDDSAEVQSSDQVLKGLLDRSRVWEGIPSSLSLIPLPKSETPNLTSLCSPVPPRKVERSNRPETSADQSSHTAIVTKPSEVEPSSCSEDDLYRNLRLPKELYRSKPSDPNLSEIKDHNRSSKQLSKDLDEDMKVDSSPRLNESNTVSSLSLGTSDLCSKSRELKSPGHISRRPDREERNTIRDNDDNSRSPLRRTSNETWLRKECDNPIKKLRQSDRFFYPQSKRPMRTKHVGDLTYSDYSPVSIQKHEEMSSMHKSDISHYVHSPCQHGQRIRTPLKIPKTKYSYKFDKRKVRESDVDKDHEDEGFDLVHIKQEMFHDLCQSDNDLDTSRQTDDNQDDNNNLADSMVSEDRSFDASDIMNQYVSRQSMYLSSYPYPTLGETVFPRGPSDRLTSSYSNYGPSFPFPHSSPIHGSTISNISSPSPFKRSEFTAEDLSRSYLSKYNFSSSELHGSNLAKFDLSKTDRAKFKSLRQVKDERKRCDIRVPTCAVCFADIRDKSDFAIHMSLHSLEDNHNCPVCLKVFSNRANLLRHSALHVHGMLYQCPICSKTIKRGDNFQVHMRKQHPGQNMQMTPLMSEFSPDKTLSTYSNFQRQSSGDAINHPHSLSLRHLPDRGKDSTDCEMDRDVVTEANEECYHGYMEYSTGGDGEELYGKMTSLLKREPDTVTLVSEVGLLKDVKDVTDSDVVADSSSERV